MSPPFNKINRDLGLQITLKNDPGLRDFLFKQMENKEILEWLKGPGDYEQGRALFEKYSRKKPLIQLFRRKYKPVVLRYNLEKLASRFTGDETGTGNAEVTPPASRRLVVLDGRVRLEDLPCHLKPLYEQNRTLYKQMRALHEKMKLSTQDKQRAKLREEIARYDDVIAGNWEHIDGWNPEEDQAKTEAEPVGEEETQKQIGANRKFLSVNLRKARELEGLKRQQLIFKIGERARQLEKLGIKIKASTRHELEELGIDL